jgi:hypothetical protein
MRKDELTWSAKKRGSRRLLINKKQPTTSTMKENTVKIKEGLLTSPKLYRATLMYRISPLFASGAVVAFLWLIILCEGASSPKAGSLLLFISLLSLFMLALGGLLCLTTVNTSIFVAPEGLLYRSMGTCVYTPWKNIVDVEKKTMGSFTIENLRLRLEAIDGMSLEEGIKEQIAVITKVGAMRATEEALPIIRGLAIILSIIAIFSGGSRTSMTRSYNPSLQKYIPVGLFGSLWKVGDLGSDISRYRQLARQ